MWGNIKVYHGFYGGRAFVEMVEPGCQMPDVENGITEMQRLQLGDFIVSVENTNVENYTTTDISKLIVKQFKCAGVKLDRQIF